MATGSLINRIEKPDAFQQVNDKQENMDLITRANSVKGSEALKEIMGNPEHEVRITLKNLQSEYYSYKNLLSNLEELLPQEPQLKALTEDGNDDALIYAVCRELAGKEPTSDATH